MELGGNQRSTISVTATSSDPSTRIMIGMISKPQGATFSTSSSTSLQLSWTSPARFQLESWVVFARDLAKCEASQSEGSKPRCSDLNDTSMRNPNYDLQRSFDYIFQGLSPAEKAAITGGVLATILGGINAINNQENNCFGGCEEADDYEEYEEDVE